MHHLHSGMSRRYQVGYIIFMYPPPLSFLRGGGSLGQPKIFRYGSLCCCVGDCVVGYCRLYPLYSWQDILLTFAELGADVRGKCTTTHCPTLAP